MKGLGAPRDASEEQAEAALGRWSAIVGHDPRYGTLLPSVMMPMHMAADAIPYGVTATGNARADMFLKVYEQDMPVDLDVVATAQASRQAASLGLAPALLAEDADHKALLYAMLSASWRPAMRPDMERDTLKAAALTAKRTWHHSAPLLRTRTPFERIAGFLEDIDRLAGPRAESTPVLTVPHGFHTLRAWVHRIERAMAAAGHDSGPIHGENTLSNIMVGDGDAVLLVDFDRAVNADPHYDLGAFCSEFCSFDEEVAETVALYLGQPDRRVTARAQLYMIVDDVLWGCWSLLAHHTSARSSNVEFYKYAQNRFVRARSWLSRWDVSALMRQI